MFKVGDASGGQCRHAARIEKGVNAATQYRNQAVSKIAEERMTFKRCAGCLKSRAGGGDGVNVILMLKHC